MRKITVLSMISLDGVMQAPGGKEEDTSNGFELGGWTAPFGDEIYGKAVQEEMKPAEYILGRKTFEIWENYWPEHGDIWPAINDGMKYVFSNSRNKTDWKNTAFIKTVEDIKNLKSSTGPNIQVWGSSELVHLLLEHGLADELKLKIHPVFLGNGKKIFNDSGMPNTFELANSVVNSKGVIIAHYKKAGNVETGNAGNNF